MKVMDNFVKYYLQEYSVEFSSYFNVMWEEPRLEIPELFLTDINSTSYSQQVNESHYCLQCLHCGKLV